MIEDHKERNVTNENKKERKGQKIKDKTKQKKVFYTLLFIYMHMYYNIYDM